MILPGRRMLWCPVSHISSSFVSSVFCSNLLHTITSTCCFQYYIYNAAVPNNLPRKSKNMSNILLLSRSFVSLLCLLAVDALYANVPHAVFSKCELSRLSTISHTHTHFDSQQWCCMRINTRSWTDQSHSCVETFFSSSRSLRQPKTNHLWTFSQAA